MKLKLLIFSISVIYLNGCRKFVQIEPAPNMIIDKEVFSDSAGASSAVMGIYLDLASSSYDIAPQNGYITFYTGLNSDEIYSSRTNPDDIQSFTNSFISTSNTPYQMWYSTYVNIYNANLCIEGLNKSVTLKKSVKDQLVGECLVVRALLYFNLVNLYGDVPFITSSDYKKNEIEPRKSSNEILTAILSDVNLAQDQLQDKYPSAGRVRVNKSIATAFSARLNLYLQKWVDAEQAATRVIDNPDYILDADLNKVFLSTSQEAVWQVFQNTPGYHTAEGAFFVPLANDVIPTAVISEDLLTNVATSDERFYEGNWVKSNTVDGQKYFYPYKYKLGQDGSPVPNEYYTLIRKAEMYLIRAEARAQLGLVAGSNSAISDINTIRARAGLNDTTASSVNEVMSIILKERRLELFTECGHRWFDLKRTGAIDSTMTKISPIKGTIWNNNKKVWPIPQLERQRNPFLTQNPGY